MSIFKSITLISGVSTTVTKSKSKMVENNAVLSFDGSSNSDQASNQYECIDYFPYVKKKF